MEFLSPFLSNEDSYVYLHAVQALRNLGDIRRDDVIDFLIKVYVGGLSFAKAFLSGNSNCSLDFPFQRFVVFAEALILTLRRSGDLAPKYCARIISSCLPISRISLSENQLQAVEAEVNLLNMKMKNTETRNNTSDAALLADIVLYRQSSVVLMMDAAILSGWTFSRIWDVVDVATSILMMEKQYSQIERASRRYDVKLLDTFVFFSLSLFVYKYIYICI